MKKKLFLAGMSALLSLSLIACQSKNETSSGGETSEKKQTLEVAALESAYGKDMWTKIVDAYREVNPDVEIKLTADKNLEDVISPNMKAGNYPDVVLLATGRKMALTETLIKDKALEDLTDVLDKKVYGEEVPVKDKLVPGFTDTLATNPYNDGKTYMAPMFYSPTGLFYNAALFKEKGWEVPKTWDEMWALGDKAKAEGISLFTYPTTGYFDAFFYSLLLEAGGPEFYNKAMKYEDGIWKTPEAAKAFDIVGKLAKYTAPTTVANANDKDYTKNQQLILDNKALFMPNGTWVVGEMKDAPRAKNFEWGMTSLPALESGGDRYAFTFFEQMWIPAQAKNKDAAKDFLTFVYSDKAADIFAQSGAVQPIKGMSDKLSGENKLFYSIYDNGAKAGMGGFAATEAVEGVSMADTLFHTIDSIVTGDKTVKQWQDAVEKASDKLRAALK
ncbi:carbohydrate ABC transporter substrate-binding protein [Neobacillus kokaensis]|uniref:Carbohydrate ABC transporter, N-acetylglucosamine/diacetylchitobiose-binding protein n=1 Tax=Neobacillus kokaensis TaxID=2759023 RepID=A0ABQ3N7W2_9BACI|nr:carbohydrate ABC transporter substrate-binding protein [Neobacillus kokaensis]GHH99945.1 carbohydrate ABC transporter, N-acetylglucosamine/diacetylchitobiose-binding protein [Neobacillus kokaensis]